MAAILSGGGVNNGRGLFMPFVYSIVPYKQPVLRSWMIEQSSKWNLVFLCIFVKQKSVWDTV